MTFEEMLQRREDYESSRNKLNITAANPNKNRQKSNKGASLYDFIKMLDNLLELTMPQVKFIPDEGKVMSLDAMTNFDRPVITYQVINRKPKKEIKPRVRELVEEITDDKNSQRIGEIWGQKFECLVQFNVFASVYSEAEQVMEGLLE